MQSSETLSAVKAFLDAVWKNKPPCDASLCTHVDALQLAYHNTPSTEPVSGECNAPKQDWQAIYGEVAKRFPDYGYYAVADPLDMEAASTMLIGDAIDDIVDITKDLRDTIWYAQNIHIDEAHWYFRGTYSHRGRHARELSLYLFAR